MLTETIFEVKERPILFSTEMVKAIQQGRKTQTRRLSGLDEINLLPDGWKLEGIYHNTPDDHVFGWFLNQQGSLLRTVKCPYGKPGDELWLKESWAYYRPFGGKVTQQVLFKADEDHCGQYPVVLDGEQVMVNHRDPWKNAMYLPKAHAKRWLRITDIRVERLQDISPGDAGNEGVEYWNVDTTALAGGELFADYRNYTWKDDESHPDYYHPTLPNPIASFRTLWQSINGEKSWEENPWVWKVEFERIIK